MKRATLYAITTIVMLLATIIVPSVLIVFPFHLLPESELLPPGVTRTASFTLQTSDYVALEAEGDHFDVLISGPQGVIQEYEGMTFLSRNIVAEYSGRYIIELTNRPSATGALRVSTAYVPSLDEIALYLGLALFVFAGLSSYFWYRETKR